MNRLDCIFSDLMAFCDELTKDYGAAVRPSEYDFEKLKKDIISDSSERSSRLQKSFYLIERVEGEILFSHNVDVYLGLATPFDLMQFLSHIDDGSGDWTYLADYLSWAKATYSFVKNHLKGTDLYNVSFKIRMPMMCADGNCYWVIQESRFLEIDIEGNLISHVNTYNISNHYNEQSPVGLYAELFFNDKYQPEWSQTIAENRFSLKPFSLKPAQKEILKYFFHHPDSTIKQCAETLKYPANTIKKYISDSQRKQGIIDKAKVSFPGVHIRSIKEVVHYLNKIGWYKQK